MILLCIARHVMIKLIARLAREDSILRKRAVHGNVEKVSLMTLRLVHGAIPLLGAWDRMEVGEASALCSALLWLMLRILKADGHGFGIRFIPSQIFDKIIFKFYFSADLEIVNRCTFCLQFVI